jgi:hypothetical protein
MNSLYNFDHGMTAPRNIKIGPFLIEITQQHCTNLNSLHRRSKTHFSYDENLQRTVTRTPKTDGQIIETAVVIFKDDENGKSKIFSEIPNSTQLHDLVLILSFLTGRRVYLEDNLTNHPTMIYSDSVVGGNYFFNFNDFWDNVSNIEKQGMSSALYSLVCESSTNCLIGKAGYSNSAFDVVTSFWSKNNRKTKYDDLPLIKKGAAKLLEKVDGLLLRKIRDLLASFLSEENVPPRILQDISARLNLYSSPSAIYKATEFLKAQGLYPLIVESEDVEKRLRWVNMVRNAVAHQGDIPKDKNLSFETRMRISAAVVFLVGEISKIYIAKHVLGIYDYSIEQSEKDILSFFENGEYRGDKVFEESYSDYMTRIEKKWVEDGELT